MELKSKVSFICLLFIFICYRSIPSLNKIGGRKCPAYKSYKPSFTFKSGKECEKRLDGSINFANLSTLEEIQKRGYNASTHSILSEDGYISTIIRIAGCPKFPPKRGKESVLVFHGLGGSSANWIIQRGNRNLAFNLADAGYEVWLADTRGTSSSMAHTHLDPDKDLSYWNFNLDDVGSKDLPLFVDLIRNQTGMESVYFICHSTGCAQWLAGLTEVLNFSDKFKVAILLSPAAYIGTMYNPIAVSYQRLIFGTPNESLFFNFFKGRWSSEPNFVAKAMGLTLTNFCDRWSFMRCGVCDNLLFSIFGNDVEQLDYQNLPNILSKMHDNLPQGLVQHQMQTSFNCDFRKFDYGRERNLVEYGSEAPPQYNLKKITVPIHIFYAENDNLVTKADVERTKDALSPEFMKGFYQVEWPHFNHPDFYMAKDADVLVYHKIINIMKKSVDKNKRSYLLQHRFKNISFNNNTQNQLDLGVFPPLMCMKE